MTDHDQELLAELLLQWEELYECGQDSSPAELCRDCPHLVEELGKRIAAMKATAWLNNPDCGEDPTEDSPGHVSGDLLSRRYRLDDRIATGGFAEVWRAFDTELQRIVAIKLPKPSRLASTLNFMTEARRVARLKHPGIVPVFDVGTEQNRCFIVSEYVEGGSLADRLARTPTAGNETVVRWLAEIAAALEYAHLHGVIHRDIKPANILIDHHGRALLADFGIAQSAQKTGTFAPSLGTLRYMSPEQLEGKAATPQSDVYSLGVVLHECLTGRLPYSTSEPTELRRQILGGTQCLNPTASNALLAVCQKAMKRLPHERHSSAAHFATELQRAAHTASPGRSWWKSLLLVTALATSLLIVAITVGAIGMGLPRTTPVTAEQAANPSNPASTQRLSPATPADLPQVGREVLTETAIKDLPFAEVVLMTGEPLIIQDLQEGSPVSSATPDRKLSSLSEELIGLQYSLLPARPDMVTGIRFKTGGRILVGTDWHQQQGFLASKWTTYLATRATARSGNDDGLKLWDIIADAGDVVPIPSSCVVIGHTIDTATISDALHDSSSFRDEPFAEVVVETAKPMLAGVVGDNAFAKGEIPQDLVGLDYVHGGLWNDPVVITFTTAGRIAFLSAWRGGQPAITALDDQLMRIFAVRRVDQRIGEFDIWDITGNVGDRFVIPDWGTVVATAIEARKSR